MNRKSEARQKRRLRVTERSGIGKMRDDEHARLGKAWGERRPEAYAEAEAEGTEGRGGWG